MIFSELRAEVVQVAKRGDRSQYVVDYAAHATEQINRRLGLALVSPVADDDTNEILADWPLLYIYACLAALYEDINEGDNVRYYNGRFTEEIDLQNITSPAASATPVMTGA